MIIRSFHFIISAKAFSDLESINMPTPFDYSLLVLRHAEVVINVNFSYFSYLIFSSWQILWSTIPKMFILLFLVSSASSFHLYYRRIVRTFITVIFNICLQLTDLSYAVDIALVSTKIVIHINMKKTQIISIKHNTPVNIELENCNFKYHGTWMMDLQNDFEIGKAQALSSIHKMKLIWNTKMRNLIKISTFKATIEQNCFTKGNTRLLTPSYGRKQTAVTQDS